MNIVICGAGEVGRHAAEVLSNAGHNITVIDRKKSKLNALEETLDVRTMLGNAVHASVLEQARVGAADLFLAATNIDEINLLAANIAKGVGAEKAIARVHHGAYLDTTTLAYADQLDIDHLVCPDQATANEIAQTLRSPGSLAVERFAHGKIEIQELIISEKAPAAGKQLIDLKFPPATRLAAVRHEGKAFIPNAGTVINAGDQITLIGDEANFTKAREMFADTVSRRTKVMLLGSSPIAVWLCRALRSRRFSIRLLETDRRRSAELAEKLEWVTVIRADPTEPMVLEEEHADQVDAFVAVTDDDERNILAAARAKTFGIGRAIAVLQRPTYLHLLEHVGIDRAFSPRVTAVTEILRLLDDAPVRKLASLADGIADVFEVVVSDYASDVVGQPLKGIHFPDNTLVAAIQRDEEAHVPGANDVIESGDHLIVIGPSDSPKRLRKLFAPR